MQTALQAINALEQDAEARADKLADVVLLRPRGLALCYSRQTTLQVVVQGGPECEAQPGLLMKHFPHKPYAGRQ